jgi:hypothetical protein
LARKRFRSLLLALPLALGGCDAVRLYAKDLLNPRASAAVTVPVDVSVVLFVLPPSLLWLPISIVPLLVFHDEPAVWFALAPGLIIGGPITLLAGTPGYLLTDKPAPESVSVAAIASLISSS